MTSPIIYWFRNDLRLDDLPGLTAALATGAPVLPCYVLDEESPGEWQPGGASRWWLHHSLGNLEKTLRAIGAQLVLRRGDSGDQLRELARQTGATAIYCSRQYEPWAAQLEKDLHQGLGGDGVAFKRYPGTLLFEPESVSNQSGLPFRVFTPFWRRCRGMEPGTCLPAPGKDAAWFPEAVTGDALESWTLTPRAPDWASQWNQWWQPGVDGAREKFHAFLQHGLPD